MAPLIGIAVIIVGIAIWIAMVAAIAASGIHIHCRDSTKRLIRALLILLAGIGILWSTLSSGTIVVILAHGWDSYDTGLRITNRRGDLSNGLALSESWKGVWFASGFLLLPGALYV